MEALEEDLRALGRLARDRLTPDEEPPDPTRWTAAGLALLLVVPGVWTLLAGPSGVGALGIVLAFPLAHVAAFALLRTGAGFTGRDRLVAGAIPVVFLGMAALVLSAAGTLRAPGTADGGAADAVGSHLIELVLVVAAPAYFGAMAWALWPWTGRRTRPAVALAVGLSVLVAPAVLVGGLSIFAPSSFVLFGWLALLLAGAGIVLRGAVALAPPGTARDGDRRPAGQE